MADEQYDVVMDPNLAKNEYPVISKNNKSMMAKYLTPEIWEELKDHRTASGQWTLAQAINTGCVNEDSLVGMHAGDIESYTDFAKMFDPVIEDYHGGYTPDRKHVTDLDPSKLVGDIDDKSMIKTTRIRVARNLYGFPLNPSSTKEQRLAIEKLMIKVTVLHYNVLLCCEKALESLRLRPHGYDIFESATFSFRTNTMVSGFTLVPRASIST